jgi:hypothetical protein
MKNLIKLFFIGLSITLLSGCGIHNGYMNNSASLGEANFGYVKQGLIGTSSTLQVLGIGGLDKMAMVEEAKQMMLKDNPLQPNQALANITVNWKNSFFLLVFTTDCTVTADIVEFK